MKLGSKKHKLTKRLLQINPQLTVSQMAYRLKVFDAFESSRKVAL